MAKRKRPKALKKTTEAIIAHASKLTKTLGLVEAPPPGVRPPRSPRNYYSFERRFEANPNRTSEYQNLVNEGARRINAAMLAKNWLASELARQASSFLPKVINKRTGEERDAIGRYSMSQWLAGRSRPNERNLWAIAQAVGMEPKDLIPHAAPQVAPFTLDDLGNGRMNIYLCRSISKKAGMAITRIIDEEDKV